MRRGAWIAMTVLLAVVFAACPTEEPRQLSSGDGDVPLHLVITNQDLGREHIGLTVALNGEDVITGDFAVEDQHRLYEFEFAVEEGPHEVHIRSEHGEEATEVVHATRERWVWISYWGDAPDTYDIRVQDHPVYID